MTALCQIKTYEEAKAIINGLALPTFGEQKLPLTNCTGRIMAQNLYAPIDSPPFSNSAMDGYGFIHQGEHQMPLKVIGVWLAGRHPDAQSDPYDEKLNLSECAIKIMTGAPIPPWVDTVIPVEECDTSPNGKEVIFRKIPPKGANIRSKGEDLPTGSLLLKEGTLLSPEHIMVAAAFGFPELSVKKIPKIIVCSTGDELKDPGTSLGPGEIYNSSGFFLIASLKKIGVTDVESIHLPDDPEDVVTFLHQISSQDEPTLILSTGGVSMGDADFIPKILEERLGFETLFHKVAIRPGKPVFLGQNKNLLWLGLPGNPISTAIGWHFFARPLLCKIMGIPQDSLVKLTLKNDVTKPSGLRCFYRAEVRQPFAWVSSRQGSAHFAASLTSEAYVILPEALGRIPAGTKVDALLIH